MTKSQSSGETVTTQITDKWGTTTDTDDRNPRPASDHPAVWDVDIEAMALTHPADGWKPIPHPDEIETLLEEDVSVEQSVLPDHVREAVETAKEDASVDQFLVMGAADVYEYLYKIQQMNDLHFENFERRQLVVNQLSNGNRNGKMTTLETYDKKWLATWEALRRLENRNFDEWKEMNLTKDQNGLAK